jgi:hypothetical protein
MLNQVWQYETNIDEKNCYCGVSGYWSEVFGSFVPCGHMIHCGTPRPKMPNPPSLVYSEDQTEFHLVAEKETRPGEEPSPELVNNLINLASQSVKQLSKTRKTLDEVKEWVTQNFPPTTEMYQFVNNIPTTVYELISQGVLHYTEKGTEEDPERAH